MAATGEGGIGHEIVVSGKSSLGIPVGAAVIDAGGIQQPALGLVIEVGDHDLLEHLLMHGGVLDGHERLNAPIEVSGHPIGGGNEDLGFAGRHGLAVGKGDDPGVLQIASDDTLDTDVFGKPRNAGPQAANPPHHQIDLHPGAAGVIESVNDFRMHQRVHLGPDGGGFSRASVLRLGADKAQQFLLQTDRRIAEFFELGRLGIAGDVIEKLTGIAPQGGVRREQRQVGVNLRRHRVIIAGAIVGIGAKPVALSAHDQG